MSFADRIRSIFSRAEEGYQATASQHGLLFQSKHHKSCEQGKAPARLQSQYLFLQMLVEAGEAEGRGLFLLPSERACALDEAERELLGLPAPWPGSFELFTSGHTYETGGFHPELRLLNAQGRRARGWELEGPYLRVDGEEFLPSAAQYLALSAINSHAALPAEQQTEGANIAAVYALQKADAAGAHITLRQFDRLTVEEAPRLGISIVEQADGSLRLVPEFGVEGVSPEDIENRLHQLKGADAVCMRVGNRFVMLDERKLEGLQDILTNRNIPAKDRDSFLKAPGAFLNAYLVDLDDGFSIRVCGETVFRRAYFGEDDGLSSDWFGLGKDIPVLLLEYAAPLIHDVKELETFTEDVRTAAAAGRSTVTVEDVPVLIPSDPVEREKALEKVSEAVRKRSSGGGGSSDLKEKLTIDVELNDDAAFGEGTIDENLVRYYWQDSLSCDPMKRTPFPHQEEGIRWLVGHALHASERGADSFEGALLADDMGLGKTFMTLAGVNAWQNIQRQRLGEKFVAKPILVVAPVVLLENWKEEIDKTFISCPFSSVIILHSSGDMSSFRNKDVVNERLDSHALKVGREFGSSRLDMPGSIVITNYDTLRRYPFSLGAVDWGMVIFDEAQYVKNPNALSSRAAKGLKADFRLAVTGTPVENSLIDFWNIFDTINPGVLGPCQDFRHSYISPILNAEDRDTVRRTKGNELREVVGHFMMRRTKEDELSGLPKKSLFVGGKNAEAGEVPSLAPVMSGRQKDAYDAVIDKVAQASAAGMLMQVLLPALRELRDISLHPLLAQNAEFRFPTSLNEAKAFIGQSAKLQTLMNILDEIRVRQEKVIIFAINRRLQSALAASLQMVYGLEQVSVVNGDQTAVAKKKKSGESDWTGTRKGLIMAFEQRPGFGIIIMSPLAVGVGLTVIGANNVIHLERHWNPAKEAQASDRVYRIGQTRDVNIYVPILEHPDKTSFDRNLDQLLKHKVDLKDAVVTPGEVNPDMFNVGAMIEG